MSPETALTGSHSDTSRLWHKTLQLLLAPHNVTGGDVSCESRCQNYCGSGQQVCFCLLDTENHVELSFTGWWECPNWVCLPRPAGSLQPGHRVPPLLMSSLFPMCSTPLNLCVFSYADLHSLWKEGINEIYDT